MARLSTKNNVSAQSGTRPTNTINEAGGKAYTKSPKLELANLVLSSFLAGDAYRSEAEVLARIKSLASQIEDKAFLAKTALYARHEFGMRTMSHVLAGEIASKSYSSGKDWAREFYNAIIYRVDDLMEVMAYYFGENPGHALPSALKKGFAESFRRFDAYQLAKYKGENRSVKLVDVVRLVRPKPTAKNEIALEKLLEGTLKNLDTWESKISKAGAAETPKAKVEARAEAWNELLQAKRLGYLALVRNLVNIANDTDEATFKLALELLVNREALKSSKILPFQLYIALKSLDSRSIKMAKRSAVLIDGLTSAIELALDNVPALSGSTLVAVDISGSMDTCIKDTTNITAGEIAALFGVVLAKANNADLMLFNDKGRIVPVPKSRSIVDLVREYSRLSGGTSFESIFSAIGSTKYDRIFILSDMQAWVTSSGSSRWDPSRMLANYKNASGKNPFVYSWDLVGHGTMQVPEEDGHVVCLAGWSDKVFDILKNTEEDRMALVHAIENYPIKVPIKVRGEK